jgi:hypothetical protein
LRGAMCNRVRSDLRRLEGPLRDANSSQTRCAVGTSLMVNRPEQP